MKTIGVLLLFLSCTVIGIGICERRRCRERSIGELIRDLPQFIRQTEQNRRSPMEAIQPLPDGIWKRLMQRYLQVCLAADQTETSASAVWEGMETGLKDAEKNAIETYLGALNGADTAAVREASERLLRVLDQCRTEAAEDGKTGKIYRTVWMLLGACLAILLL